MEKKLRLYEPLFSKNMHTSVPFSIIGANKDYMNWIYCECISTKYDTNYSNYSQDNWTKNCPLIIRQKINKDILFPMYSFDIIEFIKSAINKNTFVLLAVNHSYISQSIANGKDIIHTLFIYGYSDSEERLFLADHFFDSKTKYSKGFCSYEEFKDSYDNIGFASDSWPWGGFLLKYWELYEVDINMKYEINYEKLIYLLKDYLYNEKKVDGIVYGINCYDYLISDIKEIARTRRDISSDVQNLFFLCQYKSVMIKRIEYLEAIKEINIANKEVFYDIEQKSKIALNLLLKYEIAQNTVLLRKIIHTIECIRSEEYIAFSALIEALL